MKWTKWLSLPLFSTTLVCVLPIVSCSKNKDINISDDLQKYVDVTQVSETLTIGEPYIMELSIKDNQLGKQYLPNSLTNVKSGDKELYQINTNVNDWSDYYTYYTYDNNTRAVLTIYSVTGSIFIEGSTSTLKSVTATGLDWTGSDYAEFEEGETLSNNTSRVVAVATLTNDDSFLLTTGYEIVLDNFQSGYTFKSTDIGKTGTGTVKYNGITSSTFNYKVNAVTVAWMVHTLSSTTITKYSSIDDAIDAYNTSSLLGKYKIYLISGTYSFEGDAPITLTQSAGKYLTIEAEYDPYYEDGQMVYSVEFNYKYTDSNQSLIKIVNDANTALSSIDIRGIQFNAPTTDATITNPVIYDILLDSGVIAAHNITIKHCKFFGDKAKPNIVNAIGTVQTATPAVAPTNIYIGSCIGQYLNELYDGYIGHDATSLSYDLTMYYVLLEDSKQLCNIYGSELVNCFRDVSAYIMYEPTSETTTNDAGVVINGTGTYDISKCKFTQLTPLDNSVSMASFIKTNKLDGSTGSTKQINLHDSYFVKSVSEKEENVLHSIWNASNTSDYNWLLSVAGIQIATIYGDSTQGSIYWD